MRKGDAGGIADWMTDRVMRGLIRTALALPYERRVPWMGRLVRDVVAPVAGYRARAMRNLGLIHPDMPAPERRRIADAVTDNAGRTLIENYAWAEFGARLAVDPIGPQPGLDPIRKAHAAGRPVIFVTAHYGNYEAPRHALKQLGFSIGGIYRAMSNPFFNAHYVRTMQSVSGPVFEKGPRGTMGFARHLKAGGMATILFDIHDAQGVEIGFLGRPALTATSAADLALRFDALLVPYFGIRRPDGLRFDIAIEAPVPHGDPIAMTREMTARLEARIAADPGQWFWVHNRWKSRGKSLPDPA